MRHHLRHGCLIVVCVVAAAACRTGDTVAVGGDGGASLDGRGMTADAGLWETYCDGEGPPVLVGDGGEATDVCSGDLAEATFEHALCSCEDLALSASLVTDSFDSGDGPYTPGGSLGSVAGNQSIQSNATVDVRGDLTSAAVVSVAGTAAVLGNLASGANLGASTASFTVGGDASIGGDIDVTDLTVAGTLTVPAASTIGVTGTSSFGTLLRAPVAVAAPCDCAPDQLLDVAGFVAAHRVQNHNDTIPMTPDHLSALAGPTELSLPCGLYYLSGVGGTGALTIRATGRVALFIDGDVDLDDLFTVIIEPNAELDLFITGAVTSSSALRLGDPTRPSALRIYLGSTGSLDLSATSTVAGNLYAPQAVLNLSGAAEIFGALFVRRIASSSGLTIHYDETIKQSGEDCPIVN